jgi:hypothetical protein
MKESESACAARAEARASVLKCVPTIFDPYLLTNRFGGIGAVDGSAIGIDPNCQFLVENI